MKVNAIAENPSFLTQSHRLSSFNTQAQCCYSELYTLENHICCHSNSIYFPWAGHEKFGCKVQASMQLASKGRI